MTLRPVHEKTRRSGRLFPHRAALYLAFIWANMPVAWEALGGEFSRAWWLMVLATMASLSLISLVTTDPGKVPSDTVQQLCAAEAGVGVTQQQQSFNEFCSLCNTHKPARTHHCRICNRCVRKMDHHCHWVGHCVGHDNYKAYLLVLLYGCGSSAAMLMILWAWWRHGPKMGWLTSLALAVDGLLLLIALLCVGYLLLWHGYLVTANVTTIEYFKWRRSMRDPEHYAPVPWTSVRQSEYNRGLCVNLREALGQDVCLWFWPGLGQWNSHACVAGGGGGWGSAATGWFSWGSGRSVDTAPTGTETRNGSLFSPASLRPRSRTVSAAMGDAADGVEMPPLRSPASPTNSV